MQGLYLAFPHGSLIYEGKKVAIAKDRPYPDLVGEFLLVSGGVKSGETYGRVVTDQEGPLSPEEFRTRFDEHRVTEKEQAKWWPQGEQFYLYVIKEFNPFETPLPVEVDAGVQTLMGEVHFKEATMPWKVFPREGKFCVYKIDADDQPVGDTLGCHDTEAEARVQQSALYAAEQRRQEGEKEVLVPFGVTSLSEVDAIEKAREAGVHSAKRKAQVKQVFENIIEDEKVAPKKAAVARLMNEYEPDGEPEEEAEEGEMEEDEKGTAEDNNLPDSAFLYVEPGDKDGEGKTIPRSKRHLPYKKADGSIDLPRLRNALSRLGQAKTGGGESKWLSASLRERLIAKARRILESASKKSIIDHLHDTAKSLLSDIKSLFSPKYTVKVVGDYLVTMTTNGFIDREGEIFTTKSIEDFIARHKDDEVKGECWYRHFPGSKYADTVYQGLAGRFLVEVHKFDDTPIGQAFKSLFTTYPTGHPEVSPEGWGCSHGYFYDPIDRKDKVYEWFEKRETSVLPLHVASNPHTSMEVMMNDSSLQELKTLLGDERAAEIVAMGERLTKELEASGVAFKESSGPVEVPEVPAEEAVAEVVEETTVEDTQPVEVAEVTEELTEEKAKAIEKYLDLDGLVAAFKVLQEQNTTLQVRLAEVEKDHEAILAEKEMNLPRWPWSNFCPSTAAETQVKENDPIMSQLPAKVPATVAAMSEQMRRQ
jgi:hypothetical protein